MRKPNKVWTMGLLFIFTIAIVFSGCSKSDNTAATNTNKADITANDAAKGNTTIINKAVIRALRYILNCIRFDACLFFHKFSSLFMLVSPAAISRRSNLNKSDARLFLLRVRSERIITDLAQNHDIIFTTSFGYMDYTLNVAKKFPKIIFEHSAGHKTANNMGTYFGKNFEGSYLAGIAAGIVTKKNLLGYVGAFPIPEVIYNINAFALGAQSVNPDAKVSVVWSNTWYDPTTERQAAISLLDKGADVLLAYRGSSTTVQAAAERGAFASGNDFDRTKDAPDDYLTNPTWNRGPYYSKIMKAVEAGTWTNAPYMGSLADGRVDIAPLGPKIPDDVKKLVADAKAKILDGSLKVFTGSIMEASGAEKVKAGDTMSLEDILKMDWFVKGVDGTIPK
ncbi:basic membrane protein A [Paenibacillus baekrokdamisoli]|nr:BMP family ABC transporter substrate-binding protein [Paenibacillus baekrokdamisoli]MBB3070602.1 basic membrane protein A [Paenibacillus baekrokdamisoli]